MTSVACSCGMVVTCIGIMKVVLVLSDLFVYLLRMNRELTTFISGLDSFYKSANPRPHNQSLYGALKPPPRPLFGTVDLKCEALYMQM